MSKSPFVQIVLGYTDELGEHIRYAIDLPIKSSVARELATKAISDFRKLKSELEHSEKKEAESASRSDKR